jgi:hypothetical protein
LAVSYRVGGASVIRAGDLALGFARGRSIPSFAGAQHGAICRIARLWFDNWVCTQNRKFTFT